MVASEVRSFLATIPAGTAIAAPATTFFSMPPRIIDTIEVVIPPGPCGLVGWRLTQGGAAVIPAVDGTWIISDDDKIVWPLNGLNDSGSWYLIGYNLDIYDHTIHFRFLVEQPQAPGLAFSLTAPDLLSDLGG